MAPQVRSKPLRSQRAKGRKPPKVATAKSKKSNTKKYKAGVRLPEPAGSAKRPRLEKGPAVSPRWDHTVPKAENQASVYRRLGLYLPWAVTTIRDRFVIRGKNGQVLRAWDNPVAKEDMVDERPECDANPPVWSAVRLFTR